MGVKLSYGKVKEIIESRGAELLSETYEDSTTPLLIRTADGVVEERKLLNLKNTETIYSKAHQYKKKRHSIDHIKRLVESKGAELLSTEYINDVSPLLIKFPDGEIEERKLISIRNSKKLISKKQVIKNREANQRLDIDTVREIVESKGGKLLSTEYHGLYEPLTIQTADGIIEERKLCHIKKCKTLYSKKYRLQKTRERILLQYDGVKEIIESKGGTLVSTEYKGNHKPLDIITVDGKPETRCLSNINKVEYLVSKGSTFEHEVYEFIKSFYDGEIKNHNREIITPQEIDIVIPEKKLGIECNGMFWHSDLYKSKKYHLDKTTKTNDNGYGLIQITDSDWYLKPDIIKDIISKRMGKVSNILYARKCEIKKLKYGEVKQFLDNNHLQGGTNSKHNYGLYFNGELVSVMTFSSARFSKKHDYELCRFANKLGTIVVGGFSKLLSAFIKENNPKCLVSYCDISYFSGDVYRNNGFTWVRRSDPNYKYFTPNSYELESRNKYQKHKLHKLLENFDPELSEYKNMRNNGYYRIWDCGNDVYELSIKQG